MASSHSIGITLRLYFTGCSTTGFYIALDYLIDEAKSNNNSVSIFRAVSYLRDCRSFMVRTQKQVRLILTSSVFLLFYMCVYVWCMRVTLLTITLLTITLLSHYLLLLYLLSHYYHFTYYHITFTLLTVI